MNDAFANRTRRASDPAVTVLEVTPNDDADLSTISLALNVATPGTVRVTTASGSIADVQIHPGAAFPLRVRRVWETGTSATGIRALV